MAAGAIDGRLYATATAHHRAHDDAALAGLELRAGMEVVDLGCGVTVTNDRPMGVDVDGEVSGRTPIRVEVTGRALRVLVLRSTSGPGGWGRPRASGRASSRGGGAPAVTARACSAAWC